MREMAADGDAIGEQDVAISPTHAAAAEIDPALADDPRALQILSTEHWGLLSARSLVYNEAFTRAGMFLTFLSMSFVGLALLTPALGFGPDFLVIAAIVLGFDFLIGMLTFVRIAGANLEDMRATHGMNRIRRGYVRISPAVARYFVTATNDDHAGVLRTYQYGPRPPFPAGSFLYVLSTSLGLVGLIMSLVGGAAVSVLVLLTDLPGGFAMVGGALGALVIFVVAARLTWTRAVAEQQSLESLFPTPPEELDGSS